MSKHLEFILLHIIILYKNSAGSNNCPTRFSEPGRILTGHVIYTLQRKTFESCTFSCELEWQCHSVNYFLLHKTCELNNPSEIKWKLLHTPLQQFLWKYISGEMEIVSIVQLNLIGKCSC